MNRGVAAFCLGVWLASPAVALELSLPAAARLTVERNTAPDSYSAPVGVFAEGQVARIVIEGDVRRAAWRLGSPGLTPLQVIRPLRAQLKEAGYDLVLDCASTECGGFDFRFATETLPGPNMYVNIRAFQYITAMRANAEQEPQEVVTVLASTTASSAYIQIIQAGQLSGDGFDIELDEDLPISTQRAAPDDLAGQLLQKGHVVLADLTFKTGTSDLGQGPFDSLEKLAAFMEAQPTFRIALVGHTDTVGALDANIALSKKRAQSVRRRLIDGYAVPASRMDAEGMGYLSPLATNLDAAGRAENRRVEVVVLSAE